MCCCTRIIDALPNLFRRSFPLVYAGSPLVVAVSMLNVLHYDMQLIVAGKGLELYSGERGTFLSVGGQNILKKLGEAKPDDQYKLLFEPCERASAPLDPLPAAADLAEVFERFKASQLGYALVEEHGKYGVVRLSDLMLLYRNGVVETDATAADVASPSVFRMPGDTPLRRALEEMIRRRIRRVFLTEQRNTFVSDRSIMSLLFSPEALARLRASPGAILDASLREAGAIDAEGCGGRASVKDVSFRYRSSNGEWALLCERGLLTPWDLVMKPWTMGRLKILQSAIRD